MKVNVGVDISKLKLDTEVLLPGKCLSFTLENNLEGYKKLLNKARKAANGLPLHFCMEVTASYHFNLALFLIEAGEKVSVENPRRVKHFGVAQGATHKTDRADARVIAKYCQMMNPAPWRLAEPNIRELVALDRRITEPKGMENQERNRLEAPCLPELVLDGIAASIANFREQIAHLESRIKEIVEASEELSAQVRLLETIPGIAFRTAVGLLAEVGDLKDYDSAQDLAARLGLNPVHRKSGSSLNGRSRISKAGNAHARSRLYMPALSARKNNPIVKSLVDRLEAAHKPKKVALIAAERKLVMICYGVLKSKKPFDPSYSRLTL